MSKSSVSTVCVLFLATLFLMTGCIRAPFVPPQGYAFSQMKAPLDVDFNNTNLAGMNRGTAEVMNVLGLFTFGDCSAKTAAENGRISTIVHADYEHFNILGLFQKTTVIVYGK